MSPAAPEQRLWLAKTALDVMGPETPTDPPATVERRAKYQAIFDQANSEIMERQRHNLPYRETDSEEDA